MLTIDSLSYTHCNVKTGSRALAGDVAYQRNNIVLRTIKLDQLIGTGPQDPAGAKSNGFWLVTAQGLFNGSGTGLS